MVIRNFRCLKWNFFIKMVIPKQLAKGFSRRPPKLGAKSPPMFPLSCARVLEHTGLETSAHKKTWSAHKCSFKKCVCLLFHTRRSKYRWVQVQMCPSTDGSKYRWVQVQMGPSTDGSKYRWVQVQMGPSTDESKYRWVQVQMGSSTDGSKYRWVLVKCYTK